MKLNEKIEKLRTDNGLSQQDLADKVFVSRQAVQKWEKGKSQPSIDVLKLLSKLFNVTVDYLITDDEPEVEEPIEEKEPEKFENISENTTENPDKKKKHTGVKVTLGILIPALVIGGGALAIKLVKDSKQKAYDETFGSYAFNQDFDIRTQIIPDVNNVVVQITPKHDVIDVIYRVTIYANLLLQYSDNKSYDSLKEGQAITFEYPYSKISSSLSSKNPESVSVTMSGKKQNKYNKSEETTNDYSGIGGYATYNTSASINKVIPYFKSSYDGLIYGAMDLKIVYKTSKSTLTVSAIDFEAAGPRYIRKGDTFQIPEKFNTKIEGDPGTGTIRYEFDHIESGKIYYGPKAGEGSINLERNEDLIKSSGIEEVSGGKYKLNFASMVDINELVGLKIFVMENETSSVVKAYETLGNFSNLNLKAYNTCSITTALSADVAKYASQGYPFKFKAYAHCPFEINYQCNVMCHDIVNGSEQNYRNHITLPGHPLPMPTTTSYSGKSIRGYYEDKELTKLVDFTSTAKEQYIHIYAKVK